MIRSALMESGTLPRVSALVTCCDLAGTGLFALEGASLAMHHGLDMFGVIALGFCTAVGGGIARDVLLGAVPPATLRDWRYPAVALSLSALAFFVRVDTLHGGRAWIVIVDAAALALFAAAGTIKATLYTVPGVTAALLGTVTAVGGGTLRDVLLAQVPQILRMDVYASAALGGSVTIVICQKGGVSMRLSALLGGLLCFAVRLAAARYAWHLPALTLQ